MPGSPVVDRSSSIDHLSGKTLLIPRWKMLIFCTLLTVLIVFGESPVRSMEIPCNIPVFRFALERWQPEPYELVLLSDKQVDSRKEQQAIASIANRASNPANSGHFEKYSILEPRHRRDGDHDKDPDGEFAKLVAGLTADQDLPVLLVRSRLGRGRSQIFWQGKPSEFKPDEFFHSPSREEVAKRLTNGHAVVWLIILPDDDRTAGAFEEGIAKKLKSLESEIPLPEGIGLPGSELYSAIPLSMKFSVHTIRQNDPQEKSLVNLLKRFQPASLDENIPLVVPIFGKGRALEVIPGNQVDDGLIEDLSLFLSGACSCQVKELNPGFDLPFSVNWNARLFGDDLVDLPPAEGPGQQRGGPPELVPIAPGNSQRRQRR